MRPPVKAGIGLVVAITLLNLVILLTGMHTSMQGRFAFMVVSIVINGGAAFWSLTQTEDTQTFGLQFRDSAILGAVGGALIFLTTWILFAAIFPQAMTESIEFVTAYIDELPRSEEDKARAIAEIESRTAAGHALMAMWGTLLTSVVLGAMISIFKRKK